MSMNYLYQVIVSNGTLDNLIVAPAYQNKLDDRVRKAIHSLRIADLHTPISFKQLMSSEFSTINTVYTQEIREPNQSPIFDKTTAKIRSMKRKEKRAVLSAYMRIAVEVIKQYGAEEERRKHRTLKPRGT